MTKDETLKLALEWAYSNGETVFAGGGMKAVDGMNAWTKAIREVLAESEARRKEFSETTKRNMEHAEWYLSTHAQPECNHEEKIPMLACVKCGALCGTPAQPDPEPVAIVHIKDECLAGSHRDNSKPFPDGQYGLWPISTPPQRKPLTDEEIAELWDETVKYAPSEVRIKDFARAIEAKLKEKNT